MSQSEIFQKTMLAQAALMDLEAEIKHFEAAQTRGDAPTAEIHRQRAKDLLDTHLDLKADTIQAVIKLGILR